MVKSSQISFIDNAWKIRKIGRGVHLPWDHDEFSPCFRFPPYFRKFFGLSDIFLQFYLFPKNFLTFILQNFWWPFLLLVIDHKFRISPYFRCFSTFPPCFAKNISPYFNKFSLPVLDKFTYFLHTLCVFSPLFWPWCIYASPNARTGRPC